MNWWELLALFILVLLFLFLGLCGVGYVATLVATQELQFMHVVLTI